MELSLDSELYAALCAAPSAGGNCTFPGKVVLDSNLGCNHADGECAVDTVRTVRVQSLPNPIYYEYVRPPCVEQAFFNDAKRVKDWTMRRQRQNIDRNIMCADGRRDVGAGTWTLVANCLYGCGM